MVVVFIAMHLSYKWSACFKLSASLLPNVMHSPAHADEPPASAAGRQHAVGPSLLLDVSVAFPHAGIENIELNR